MVKVCDAIMGTGKSSAAINYLNEHSSDKFVYITPYLEEASRIKKGCPGLSFIEPSNKLRRFDFKKSLHTAALIREGRNIATTHQAFKGYTQETLDLIKEQGYTLIIDENVDVLKSFDFHPDDLRLAVDAGHIKDENGEYSTTDKPYDGKVLREIFTLLKSRKLIRIKDKDDNVLFYWTLPPELLLSFKDVFILTYLFEGQSLHHFMKIYNIPYERIGIEKGSDGEFRFGRYPGYTPDYVSGLKNKLHIMERDKINDIGKERFSLSMGWFKKDEAAVEQLKRNVNNCFNNIWRGVPSDKKLWGSFGDGLSKIKGKGYTKAFLTFNTKATNAYRDREYLVYVANLFMNVSEKNFYLAHGIEVDEDMYALSIMVQWIWRSAIRDGKDVYLYIPSRRMRTLLTDWIENLSKGEKS